MKKINIVVIGVVGLALLSAGFWYFVYPAFRVVEVDDALPPEFSAEFVETVPSSPETDSVEVSPNTAELPTSESGFTLPPSPAPSPASSALQYSTIEDTFGHPAEGRVAVVRGNRNIVRFEDFKTIDGPRLHVYLVKSLDTLNEDISAGDFVDLGFRRGTSGNINYEVPADVKVDDYSYVVHWCVPFGVLFNSAELL